MNTQDQIYIKTVSARELKMTRRMNDEGLSPRLLYSDNKPDENGNTQIILERYPYTLVSFFKEFPNADSEAVCEAVTEVIQEMHDIGIIHGDLHADNIVIRPKGEGKFDVKLIDFSETFDSWDWYDQSDIDNFNEYTAEKCKTIEECFAVELSMFKECI